MSASAAAPGSRFRRRRALLAVGMVAPLIAFAAVVIAAVAYPGFDHARQYLSELGGATAPRPELFNTGVLVTGVGAAIAGLGFALAVVALGGGRIPAALLVCAFTLAGVGLVQASRYPWPDERHMAINLGLGIQLAPLLLLWALWRVPGVSRLRLFLGLVFVTMAVLTVLTKHLLFRGLVNDGNVGWWESGYAIVLVGWTAVAAFALERRLVSLERDSG